MGKVLVFIFPPQIKDVLSRLAHEKNFGCPCLIVTEAEHFLMTQIFLNKDSNVKSSVDKRQAILAAHYRKCKCLAEAKCWDKIKVIVLEAKSINRNSRVLVARLSRTTLDFMLSSGTQRKCHNFSYRYNIQSRFVGITRYTHTKGKMIKSQCNKQEHFKKVKLKQSEKEQAAAFTLKTSVYEKFNQTVSLVKCRGYLNKKSVM